MSGHWREKEVKIQCPSFPFKIPLACTKAQRLQYMQSCRKSSWVHASSPQLTLMMNHIAAASQPSCPQLQPRWQDERVVWALLGQGLKKQILNCLTVGERTERPLKVRALQKMLRECWQGEPTAFSSCVIFFMYLEMGPCWKAGKYSKEMPTPSVS